jgi:NADH dehydrogenase
MGKIIGPLLGDVLITKDEINGLMANLLYSSNPPTGTTRLSQWVKQNASGLGKDYFGELKKHYR